MATTQADMIAELQRANAALQVKLDAASAQRNSEYDERIDHQAATIDVLKAMSASPGDPQPVFELIVERARDLCDAYGASAFEYDGTLIHLRASNGVDDDPAVKRAVEAAYPMAPTRERPIGRAILERRIIRIDDIDADSDLAQVHRGLTVKSVVAIPLLHAGKPIGGLVVGSRERGGFSDSQIELMKTFAEQAVIAINSAETYRALQERTAELTARDAINRALIARQHASIEVLRAISTSPDDAQPVMNLIVRHARTLCNAQMVHFVEYDGSLLHQRAVAGYERDPEALTRFLTNFPRPPGPETVPGRVVLSGRPVHITDQQNEPGIFQPGRALGARSCYAVPLLREARIIGVLVLGRYDPGEYDQSVIELVQSFAEQAVIALSSAAALRELRERTADLQESLEYQTATSDVLKVISRSTFDLQPVLDTVAETAARLCDANQAVIARREGDVWRLAANFGFSPEFEAHQRSRGPLSFGPDNPSVGARATRERRPVHIHDVAAVPSYPEASIRLGRQRTSLGMPLLREGEAIGSITLARQRVEPFTDRQIELVSTFADQAVIAIENTRLINEQREALERQTATAEILQVINASPGDLAPVFDSMLEKALHLCDGTIGGIFTIDGNRSVTEALMGVTSAFAAFQEKYPIDEIQPGTVPARIIETRRPIQIADVPAGEAYRNGHPFARALVELGNIRAVLAVPLLKDAVAVGIIAIYREDAGAFTDKQIALLEDFAAHAVIAMENARLLTEQREALEQQTATTEVLQVINESPGNLTPVFETMLEKAMRLCGAAFGSLYVYDGDHFRSAAQRGVPAAFAEFREKHPPVPSPGGGLARILATKRADHVLDVKASDLYQAGNANTRAMVDSGGVRTSLSVPLLQDAAVRGYISVYRQEVRAFSDKQIALLESFAAQAVIAMENARLLEELRERTTALAQRNSEYGERIEHQAATIDVLKVMAASPGDPSPVFDLIVKQAQALCNSTNAALYEYDGAMVHHSSGTSNFSSRDGFEAYRRQYPMLLNRQTHAALASAILDRRIVHIRDSDTEEGVSAAARSLGVRSAIVIPLIRDDGAAGAIALINQEPGGFSDSQIELLKTFAEQAVIALASAAALRALTERTADLQESLEYQTATSDVLKVISRSTFDLQPVLDTVVQTAAQLCDTDQAAIFRRDGEAALLAANFGFPAEYEAAARAVGTVPLAPTRPETAGRAMLEGHPVHIHDVTAVPGYSEIAIRLGKVRTSLGVPLMREGKAIGSIVLARQRVEPFTDRQIELVNTFADQAVIAIENTRLLTEQQEALEQQTATAEVLQVINASPGNLAPVFEAMLEKALRLCDAAFGHLATFDGTHFRSVATHHGGAEYSPTFTSIVPEPDSALGRVANGERVVQIADVADTDAYRQRIPSRVAAVERLGARTALWVALCKDDAVVGVFVIFRREVRPFTQKQIALLQNFAAQAVIAMENARLLGELQDRTAALAQRNSEFGERIEQQAATIDVLKVMSSTPDDVKPVFDLITRRARELCNGANVGLWEFDGELVHASSVSSLFDPAPVIARYPMRPQRETIAGRTILERQIIHIRNADTDPELLEEIRQTTKSIVGLPLLRDGVAIGSITLNAYEAGGLSDSQVALLQTFAEQAVIAIGSVATFRALRERTAELAQRQDELRITFENMGDGVAMFDETQHLVAWNRKFQDILDVPDEIIAQRRTLPDYVRYLAERGEFGTDADVEEQVRRVLETTGQMRVFERVRPNGSVIEVHSNPVAGGGFVLIYSDITERKRNEEAIRAARDAAEAASRTIEAAFRDLKTAQANLIQAEKMASLGQLTAGIAHEIKNPLNFVNNFAALSVDLLAELKETAAPGFAALTADQRAEIDEVSAMLTSNLEKITEHGKRADSIVKAMLEHSRGSSAERRLVDMNALVDEALNLAYHGARAQDQSFNITLERDFADGIAPIEVNPQDITRVFLNLFSNGFYAATKRARDNGSPGFQPTLAVATSDLGDHVEIRVRDNGTGIPDDIRDKLFEPFFTTKPTGEGTGLGLSITYDIVTKQHGGTIEVESEVGGHTEFTVALPRQMFASQGDRA